MTSLAVAALATATIIVASARRADAACTTHTWHDVNGDVPHVTFVYGKPEHKTVYIPIIGKATTSGSPPGACHTKAYSTIDHVLVRDGATYSDFLDVLPGSALPTGGTKVKQVELYYDGSKLASPGVVMLREYYQEFAFANPTDPHYPIAPIFVQFVKRDNLVTAGGSQWDGATDVAFAGDGSGDLLIAGVFSAGMKLGPFELDKEGTGRDSYVARVDARNRVLWVRTFGSSGHATVTAIAADATSVYVSASFAGTLQVGGRTYVAKTPDGYLAALALNDGAVTWDHHFAGTSGGAVTLDALSLSPDGQFVYVGGAYEGWVDTGWLLLGGYVWPRGCFVTRYRTTGAWHGAFDVGGAYSGKCTVGGVGSDALGNFYVAANFTGETGVTGGGPHYTGPWGGTDMIATKRSHSGAHLWTRRFGSTATSAFADGASGLAVTDAGDVYVGGHFATTFWLWDGTWHWTSAAGGTDGFVQKLTTAGAHVWLRTFGGTSDDVVTDVALDGSSSVWVAGNLTGSDTNVYGHSAIALPGVALERDGGWSDGFFAQLLAGNGLLLSQEPIGGTGDAFAFCWSLAGCYYDRVSAVAVDAAGRVATAGAFYSDATPVDFGPSSAFSNGDADAFFAVFEP